MKKSAELKAIQKEFLHNFDASRAVLSAMGDENRQLILRLLIENCGSGGLRVGEIQSNTHISRTAVSHHLKILLETGMILVRKEGTKNYYYLDAKSSKLWSVIDFWKSAVAMMSACPYVNKEEKKNEHL